MKDRPNFTDKRIKRLIEYHERGFRFTDRQIQSITKQLKQGKVPTLTLGGIKLAIDEYALVKRLTASYLSSNRIGQEVAKRLENKPTNAPKSFYDSGMIRNKCGVVLTPEQFTRLKQRTNLVNRYIQKQWYRDNALMVKGMAKISGGKYKPTEAISPRWQFTTLDFENMRRSTFNKYVERLDEIYAGINTSYRTEKQNIAQKNNFISALQKKFSGTEGLNEVIELIYQLTPETLHDLMVSQQLKHTGDVYYGVLGELKEELAKMLVSLQNALEQQKAGKGVI